MGKRFRRYKHKKLNKALRTPDSKVFSLSKRIIKAEAAFSKGELDYFMFFSKFDDYSKVIFNTFDELEELYEILNELFDKRENEMEIRHKIDETGQFLFDFM